MTPEAFAALDSLDARLVRSMLAPSGRTKNTFDERDVRRYSKRDIRLYVTRVNVAGVRHPRIVPRANPPRRPSTRRQGNVRGQVNP